jgi:hypothetical protein
VTIPGRIYAIADAGALGSTPLPEAVAAMAGAGIGWIQVRAKRLSGRELFRALEGCCRAVEESGASLWVDDRADLAALFPVAGVHVGQTDLPPAAVRRVVGPEMWLGLSTHDEAQLAAADADPEVDVIAVGAAGPGGGARFRPLGTDANIPAAGRHRRDRSRERGLGAGGGGGRGRGPGSRLPRRSRRDRDASAPSAGRGRTRIRISQDKIGCGFI